MHFRKGKAKFPMTNPTNRGLINSERIIILRIDPTLEATPSGTPMGLAMRQPQGERSRSSPSPVTIRVFDENWLTN